MTRLLLLCLLFAQTLIPQTRINVYNTIGETSGSGRVWVVLPDGRLAEADLVGVTLDTSSARPVLRVTAPSGGAFGRDVFRPAAATTVFTASSVPLAGTLDVYLNGLLQDLGPDYRVSGQTVTLVGSTAKGDVVQLRYRY